MKTVHGWQFPDADDFMTRELRPDGTYQASHLAAALSFVSDFSVAIDGGAHVGTWARLLGERFETVLAFEPSPDTFAALVANLATFACAHVQPIHAALGRTAGAVEMAIEARQAALGNTGARYVVEGGAIPMQTVDALALPSLGFLKLDVEGSEPFALEGARETLRRCRPIVLFENKYLWKRFEQPRDAPHQILRGVGYRHLATVVKDEIWGPA